MVKFDCLKCMKPINPRKAHSHNQRCFMRRKQEIVIPFVNALQAWKAKYPITANSELDRREFYRFHDGNLCTLNHADVGPDWVPTTVAEFMKDVHGAFHSQAEYDKLCDDMGRDFDASYWDHMEREGAKYGIDVRRPGDECSICGGGGCISCSPKDFI